MLKHIKFIDNHGSFCVKNKIQTDAVNVDHAGSRMTVIIRI